ncbi:hypothetical protein ACFQ1S_36400 [Kibdelosporangium lantanae]|uniref:Secreted protein n=1 Tax=Kibdelosporangium lantanae TaxID=1497396 RepID=A0ABW3MKJ1_9PSEU
MLWLAAETYLLCLVSFIAGAAVTALVLRRNKPAVEEVVTETPVEEPVLVKATKKSMRYHTPDSPYYARIKDDLTFPSTAAAEEAGFTAWNTRKTPATT